MMSTPFHESTNQWLNLVHFCGLRSSINGWPPAFFAMPGRLKNRTTWPRRDCASHGATTNWYLSLQPPPNWGLTTQNWDIINKRCRIHLYRHVLSSVIPLGYSPFLVELSLMETDILHSPTRKEEKSKVFGLPLTLVEIEDIEFDFNFVEQVKTLN